MSRIDASSWWNCSLLDSLITKCRVHFRPYEKQVSRQVTARRMIQNLFDFAPFEEISLLELFFVNKSILLLKELIQDQLIVPVIRCSVATYPAIPMPPHNSHITNMSCDKFRYSKILQLVIITGQKGCLRTPVFQIPYLPLYVQGYPAN